MISLPLRGGPGAGRVRLGLVGGLGLALVLAGCGSTVGTTPGSSGPPLATEASCSGVSAYPSPGTHTASPTTQISLQGLAPSSLDEAAVSVVGSQSGAHTGRWVTDSSGQGASFYPSQRFRAGERVTVHTQVSICGAAASTYHFEVARPPGHLAKPPKATPSASPKLDQPVNTFASLPGVQIPKLKVDVPSSLGGGYLFETPHGVTTLGGPMIVDGKGNVIWFQPLPPQVIATDFRVQTYQGQPALTLWEGNIINGHGIGEDLILNPSYQVVERIHAADGYSADLHEFLLTPQDTAWITAYSTIGWDLSSVGGPKDGSVLDGIVQEIDIATGNVLFEWHSLDHVPVSLTNQAFTPATPFDYFHVNAIDPRPNGVVVISSRNTSTIYELARATGRVLWRLGGKASSFKMGAKTVFQLQHNAEMHGPDTISIFDDEDQSPSDSPARGLVLHLDYRKRTASLVRSYGHDGLKVPAQGNVQFLKNGDVVVGWGSGNYTSEFSRSGKLLFDGSFGTSINSYRAYVYHWVGNPTTPPAVATKVGKHGAVTVYVSWNGSTETKSWEVLGGSDASHLSELAHVGKRGFQTTIRVSGSPEVIEVVALGANGKVLGRSAVVKPGSSS